MFMSISKVRNHYSAETRLIDSDGFQLLHAVYTVERFLRQLISRKCRFHIAFFDILQDICAPNGTENELLPKFKLARAVVIRHLQQNLPADSGIRVHTFRSFRDPDFICHLRENGVYFVMCHDGALPVVEVGRDDLDKPVSPNLETARRRLRAMIIWFLARCGCNVSLINEVEFKDTKVRTTNKSSLNATL
jgi:hypothetical protein